MKLKIGRENIFKINTYIEVFLILNGPSRNSTGTFY